MMEITQVLSLYQMVPNEALQFRAVLKLLLHFNWKWVGFFGGVGVNLEWFTQKMFPEFSKNGICFDFIETIFYEGMASQFKEFEKWAEEIHAKLMNSKANVVILYGDAQSMVIFRYLLHMPIFKHMLESPKGEVWVLTAQMEIKSRPTHNHWDVQFFHGALSLAVHSNKIQGFQEFLQRRNPSENNADGFIKDFWALAFGCLLPNSFLRHSQQFKYTGNCTGEEKLENLILPYLEMTMTGYSYSIYNAVYVVAHALHAKYLSLHKRAMVEGKRKALQNLQPWQLHHLLKWVSFNNSAGDKISFDENGELVAEFDVINCVTFPNQSVFRSKVGQVDPQAPLDQGVSMNKDAIVWLQMVQPGSAPFAVQ
uniref:Uncharacterized protein n=1 Tax=Sphaerodactylus townsendi TaxID=933632 RepID=A0ACB8EV46_9SAUR